MNLIAQGPKRRKHIFLPSLQLFLCDLSVKELFPCGLEDEQLQQADGQWEASIPNLEGRRRSGSASRAHFSLAVLLQLGLRLQS